MAPGPVSGLLFFACVPVEVLLAVGARATLKECLWPEWAPGVLVGTSRKRTQAGAPPGWSLAKEGLRSFAMFQAQDKLCWSHRAAGSSRPQFVFILLTARLPQVQMVLQRANEGLG